MKGFIELNGYFLSRICGKILVLPFALLSIATFAFDKDPFVFPPYQAVNLPPFIYISLDDSDSMFFLADSRQHLDYGGSEPKLQTGYYYDPSRTYLPPPGLVLPQLPPADFFAARRGSSWLVGLDEHDDKVKDLSSHQSLRWQLNDLEKGILGGPAHYYRINREICEVMLTAPACLQRVAVTATSGELRERAELTDHYSPDERQNFANWYQYYSSPYLIALAHISALLQPGNLMSGTGLSITLRTPDKSGRPRQFISTDITLVTERYRLQEWLFAVNAARSSRHTGFSVSQWLDQSATILADDSFRVISGVTGDQAVAQRPMHHLLLTNAQLVEPLSQRSLASLAMRYWRQDMSALDNKVAPRIHEVTGSSRESSYNDYANWQHAALHVLLIDAKPCKPGIYVKQYQADCSHWPKLAAFTKSGRGRLRRADGANPQIAIDALGLGDRYLPAQDLLLAQISGGEGQYDINYRHQGMSLELIARDHNGHSQWQTRLQQLDSQPTQIAQITSGWIDGKLQGLPLSWELLPADKSRSVSRMFYAMGGKSEQLGVSTWRRSQRLPVIAQQDTEPPVLHARSNYQPAITSGSGILVANGTDPRGKLKIPYPDDLEGTYSTSYRSFICGSQVKADSSHLTRCELGSVARRSQMLAVAGSRGLQLYDISKKGRVLLEYLPGSILPDVLSGQLQDRVPHPGLFGRLTAADVFYRRNWHTILAGGIGTNTGYYALEITDPDLLIEANANDIVLWEYTSTQDAGMGRAIGPPILVKSNDQSDGSTGRWVAIMGNGLADKALHQQPREAVLYVVDVASGKLIRKLSVTSPLEDMDNGLTQPVAVYRDHGYTADIVYAGDLQGNLWKFDLSSSDPEDWHLVSQSGRPLFTVPSGETPVPLTAKPMVIRHPTGKSGFLVMFGSGSYMTQGDHHQGHEPYGFFAIHDEDLCRKLSDPQDCRQLNGAVQPIARSVADTRLLRQQIIQQRDGKRVTSRRSIDWQRHQGWFLDLASGLPGERVVTSAQVYGTLVVFSSLVPKGDLLNAKADSWLMVLDLSSGASPDFQAIDQNQDAMIDLQDTISSLPTSGRKLQAPVLQPPLLLHDDSQFQLQFPNEVIDLMDNAHSGRWQWRELEVSTW